MKLYEISQELQGLILLGIDPDTGEISPEFEKSIDELELEFERKVLDIACVVKGNTAEQDALTIEIAKLKQRAKVLENTNERLEDYLLQHVAEGDTFRDARAQVGWRKSTACEVDEDLLPWKWWRVTTEKSPDKVGLTQELKLGAEIPGAKLVERRNLQIK